MRGRRLRSRSHGCPAYPHPLPQSSRHLLPRCPLRWRMLTTQPQRLRCCITKGMFSLTFCTNLLVAPKQYHMHNIKISLNKHSYTVNIGFRNHPPSEGSRFLNPARPLKQGSGYSNQVVTGRAKRVLFLFPLGLATTTAAILLYKSQILRLLNPRLLFMY